MPNLFFVPLKVMPNLSVIDLWTYIRRLIYVQFRSAQGGHYSAKGEPTSNFTLRINVRFVLNFWKSKH